MYWRQWRVVPPSLVTIQDVWSVVSMRVHYYIVLLFHRLIKL